MTYHYAHNAVNRHDKFKHILMNILRKEYDKNLAEQWATRFSSLTRDRIIRCPYVEGAIEFIELFSKKYPLYIASATPSNELEIILKERGIIRHFKKIYGAPKKKAEILRDIKKNENVLPAEILFIGDSIEDYAAAESSQVQFMARLSNDSFNEIAVRKFRNLYKIKEYLLTYGVKEQ